MRGLQAACSRHSFSSNDPALKNGAEEEVCLINDEIEISGGMLIMLMIIFHNGAATHE